MIYKLSRFSPVHNILRIIINNVLWRIPIPIKYGIGETVRRMRKPYSLLNEGSIVVQIGAPWDLLHAGRSRAIHFSRLVGDSGKVIVVEPDKKNIQELNHFIKSQSIKNICIVEKAAWDSPGTIRFLSNTKHPASNLVDEVFDNMRSDKEKYIASEIEADSLNNILTKAGVDQIDLLSITSNGSEIKIINGCNKYIKNTKYISIIGNSDDFTILNDSGFHLTSEDDRGYIYSRICN